MSDIKENSKAKVWAPPAFPVEGRLPFDVRVVTDNYEKQACKEKGFHQTRDANGRERGFDCCRSLHISLFFDGADNNGTRFNHPGNIAKLFQASLKGRAAEKEGYFSFYIPGVGTPFPEIGELDYSEERFKYATGGEDRINWALASLAHALTFALTGQALSRADRKKAVTAMSTWKAPLMFGRGLRKRRQVMKGLLGPLQALTELASPKVLGVKLYVYGFSRGAAQARTFVTWLSQLFETPDGAELPAQSLIGLPVSIEFLGVLDTVASAGITHVAPFFAGRMDWADDSQLLPEAKTFPSFVKCCRHFVAAFEQRACFPLDSIRNEDGQYPDKTFEVVYPGVHSDVGGGYSQNDQGKARGGINELVSQIVLHDLYAEAFAAGAPLQVPAAALPKSLEIEKAWRVMSDAIHTAFDIAPQVIERFNAWRQTLPGITTEEPSNTLPSKYVPQPLNTTLEDTLADQLGWITGWRIGRFANDPLGNDSYKHQPFFLRAKEVTGSEAQQGCEDYKKALADHLKSPETATHFPISPIGEAQLDKTRLSIAAAEFKRDYRGFGREITRPVAEVTDVLLRDVFYLLNETDEAQDHEAICEMGEHRARQLFRDDWGSPNRAPVMSRLVALFDDQIHDPCARFMHEVLKSRETWTGYFFYRMTYFGNDSSRRLSPVVVAGRLSGVALMAGATVYGIQRGGAQDTLGELAAITGEATIGYQVIDNASGLILPFLPEAEQLLQPTAHIGQVVTGLKRQMALEDCTQRIERNNSMLRETSDPIECATEVI